MAAPKIGGPMRPHSPRSAKAGTGQIGQFVVILAGILHCSTNVLCEWWEFSQSKRLFQVNPLTPTVAIWVQL